MHFMKLFSCFFVIATIFTSCGPQKPKEPEKGDAVIDKTPTRKPEPEKGSAEKPEDPTEKLCPVTSEKNAMKAGVFFEWNAGRIKPWESHSHKFSELEPLGWTEKEFRLAKTYSQHVDLDAKYIRFADNDIAGFLSDATLCPLTVKFLFGYLSKNDQDEFLKKMKGEE